ECDAIVQNDTGHKKCVLGAAQTSVHLAGSSVFCHVESGSYFFMALAITLVQRSFSYTAPSLPTIKVIAPYIRYFRPDPREPRGPSSRATPGGLRTRMLFALRVDRQKLKAHQMTRTPRRTRLGRRRPVREQRCRYASSASSIRRRAWRGPDWRRREGSEACAARSARTGRSDP